MKKLFLSAILILSFASMAQAQKKMIIVNHTPCEWWITPRMDYSPGSGTCGTTVHTTTFSNLVAPNTWNVVAASWPWTTNCGGVPTSYDPAWIWCYVTLSPALCTNLMVTLSGTDMGQSTWATSKYPSSTGLVNCCGDNTFTWTDLGNGNVQIDIW
ncbi:MAG: hypothetical protein JST27_09330 [Bacteroidetes bacterium]|nr:hypothetical protein [Bacteroidota bacterium]